MINTVILLSSVALVTSHDVFVGTNNLGRKIFDENLQASPAIWVRTENVTVNATNDEVISRILVTDLRPEKDGHVKIVDGGEGQKYVTVELQSPAVLRGYDFHVEIYAAPEGQIKVVDSPKNEDSENPKRIQRNPEGVTVPSHSIHETKHIILSTVIPIITTSSKVNENEKKIDTNAETANNDNSKSDLTRKTPDLNHSFTNDENSTSIKQEKDIPAFVGHSRLVRDDKHQNEDNKATSHENKRFGSDHSLHPILTAKQGVTEATNTETSSQYNVDYSDRKIIARDTKNEEVDLKSHDINSASPQTTSIVVKTVPLVNHPANTGDFNTKSNDNGPTATNGSLIPPSLVTNKRQARNVEQKDNKDVINPPTIVARKDNTKSIEEDKSTSRSPDVKEQPEGRQNTGTPNIYYPLPYSTKNAPVISTPETSENKRDEETKLAATQGIDKNVNIPQVVLNRRNLQRKQVISNQ